MAENPKTYEVILMDHTELLNDGKEEYLAVFSLDKTSYKIGAKRQHLWNIRNLPKDTPIVLTFETFTPKGSDKSITFVSDARAITIDDVLKAGIVSTLKRLLTSVDEDRQRSQALSYAKDLAVAHVNSGGATSVQEVIAMAKPLFAFIKGQPEIEVKHVDTPDELIQDEEGAK